jgi:hypothetical protein
MSQQRTPVSEVIRNSESFIHRVIDIRRRAAELSEQAARLQEEAYLAAVDELGVEDGAMAFGLACRGLGVDPTLRSGFTAPETPAAVVAVAPAAQPPIAVEVQAPVRAAPPAPRQPVVETPAPVAVVETVRQAAVERSVAPAPRPVASTISTPATQGDPSRVVRYGVEIKRAKLSEAEEVIEQARRTAAQNRKANPYADDRGRNAWRNTLFAAVLSQEAGHSADQDDEAVDDIAAVDIDGTSPAAGVEVDVHVDVDGVEDASAEEASSDGPDEDDVFVDPSDVIADTNDDHGADDDVLDHQSSVVEPAPLPAPSPPPAMPSRAVVFTNNPVQAARPPQREAEPSAPPVRQTSFSRAAPVPSPSTPEVHVDRPVQNRTFAHGQAVPMPKSFKEAKEALSRKAEDEKPASPTISPAPLRRPPPSFLDNRKDRS